MTNTGTLLVLGAGGQVGRALMQALADRDAVICLTRAEADLAEPESLLPLIRDIHPAVILNAAAYTAVDKAESEPELAHRINAEAVGVLAAYAAEAGATLVHYSTDYVFDGSGDAARDETAPTAPLNIYGQSKLAGEQAITQSGANHLIFRTSWVYDALGKNFFNTMLRLGQEREQLAIVSDQIGAPTYAPDIAEATLAALAHYIPEQSGMYHLCNQGETSWHGFAEAIFAEAREHGLGLCIKKVESIPTCDYPTPATRPLNSRLDCSRLKRQFGVTLPHWKEALRRCMAVKIEELQREAA